MSGYGVKTRAKPVGHWATWATWATWGTCAAVAALASLAGCGGGGGGGAAPAPAPAPVPAPPADPVARATASALRVYAGEAVQFVGGDLQNGISWRWEFSDTTAMDGLVAERLLAQPGSVQATVTGQNSLGVTARSSVTVQVEAAPALAPRPAGVWQPGCSGLHCATAADGSYLGAASGVGVWRLRNASSSTRVLDVDLPGVKPGQAVTLVFSHGESTDANDLPGAGTLAAPASASPTRAHALAASDGTQAAADAAHQRLLNQQSLQALDDLQTPPVAAAAPAEAPQRRARAATEVGASRVWNDLMDDVSKPVPYTARVVSTCAVPGRRVVFWVEDELSTAGTVKTSDVDALQQSFCGDAGGYALAVALLGEVWGSSEINTRPWLLQESATNRQDVNVVVTSHLGSSTSTVGYFYGVNNSYRSRSSRYANSNEALAFFVRGTSLARSPTDVSSTLVHELTHMINYHQRSVRRSVSHDSWLEETSAMATEDLLSDRITPGANKIVRGRLPNYLASGSGTPLLDWAEGQSTANYAMGGSLAAFLNRRLGPGWTQKIITECDAMSSYACLDGVLRRAGSEGLADEFERLGTTVFGGMPQRHAPQGYGFPKVQWPGYLLMGADTAEQAGSRRKAPLDALTRLGRTSHTYVDDTVPAGATRYVRRGVRVPAGTVLTVVVR